MRTRTLVLLSTVITLVPVSVEGLASRGGDPAAARPGVANHVHRPAAVQALAVLRDWDRRRLRAWARGDPAALSRLYARQSATGARDAGDLRRWVRRGVRVTGLRQQVSACRLVDRSPGRMVVVVTDRTVDGVARHGRRRTPLPGSPWAGHRITLLRHRGVWIVGEVRLAGGGAQPAR